MEQTHKAFYSMIFAKTLLSVLMENDVFAQSTAQQAAQQSSQQAAQQAAAEAARRANQKPTPTPPPPVVPQERCWWRGWGYFCMAQSGENQVAIAACDPASGACEVIGEIEGTLESAWHLIGD